MKKKDWKYKPICVYFQKNEGNYYHWKPKNESEKHSSPQANKKYLFWFVDRKFDQRQTDQKVNYRDEWTKNNRFEDNLRNYKIEVKKCYSQ